MNTKSTISAVIEHKIEHIPHTTQQQTQKINITKNPSSKDYNFNVSRNFSKKNCALFPK